MSLANFLQPEMKAVFYGRHSTDKQNMDTQLRSAYDLAEKYGIEIVEEYLDVAISSRVKDREAFKKLIKDACDYKFELIIIYSHSRLARIPEEHDDLRSTMSVLGINIVESESETLYNYTDVVYSSIKDAVAKYEGDKIRLNTKAAIETLAKSGRWTGGRAPFGYKYIPQIKTKAKTPDILNDGKFIDIKLELALVKKVFNYYKSGYGFKEISKILPKGSYRGKDWTSDRVKQIIINPFYAGYIAIRKRNIDKPSNINHRSHWIMSKSDVIDLVISPSEWEECFKMYETKREKKISPKHFQTSFFLKGLLYCSDCEIPLKPKDQTSKGYGKRIYKCDFCSPRFKIEADELHTEIKNELKKLLMKKNSELVKAVQERVDIKCIELKREMDLIAGIIDAQDLKIAEIELKLKRLFSMGGEDVDFIDILILGKDYLTKSINIKAKQLLKIQEEYAHLFKIEANEDIIQSKTKELENIEGISNIKMRSLYLYFIKRVDINSSGSIKVQLKVDLDKI